MIGRLNTSSSTPQLVGRLASSTKKTTVIPNTSKEVKPEETKKASSFFLSSLANVAKDTGVGILKGAGQTATWLSGAGEKVLQAPLKLMGAEFEKKTAAQQLQAEVEKKKGITQGELFKANTPGEKLGKGIEQAAEYFVPGSAGVKVGKAVKTAATVSRVGRLASKTLPYVAEGVTDAVTSAPLLFSQKEPGTEVTKGELGINTAISLAAPAVIRAGSKAFKGVGRMLKGTAATEKAAVATEQNIASVLKERSIPTGIKETSQRGAVLAEPAAVKKPFMQDIIPPKTAGSTPQIASDIKRSKFAENIALNPKTEPEVAAALDAKPAEYQVKHNDYIQSQAKKLVTEMPAEAENFVLTATKPSAEHTATGIELIKKMQAEGNHEGAVRVADDLSQKLTNAGQAVQAAKLYENLSPESVLVKAKTFIRKENEKATIFGTKKELSLEDAKTLYDTARKMQGETGEAKSELANEISSILADYQHNSLGKKVASIQTQAQLLNPKTQVRNVLGNELFYRVERLTKLIATPIDIAKSKLTGTERTVTFTTNGQSQYWNDWFKGLKAGFKGVQLGPDTQFQLPNKTFNNKWNPFYWGERAVGASLKSFDYAAYNRARLETLYEFGWLRAKNEGLKGDALKNVAQKYADNAEKQVLEIADQYGKYVTFQDDNVISRMAIGLKKGLNAGKDFGLGDLVLKYPKTPGALLARAMEYSPAGFLKSAYEIARPMIMGVEKTAAQNKELAMSVSRAIVGTLGFTGLGYYFADKGFLTGRKSSDKDVASLQQSVGQGKYQINLSAIKRWVQSGFKNTMTKQGDYLYTYDWAQPVAVSLSVGANMNGGIGSTAAGVGESLASGASTITEQPLLSGLTRLFQYGDPIAGVQAVTQGALSSFTPTLSNQFRQYLDNQTRDTKGSSWLDTAKNLSKNKIPGVAEQLPPKYNVQGQPMQNFENNNIFNIFLNPGNITTFKTNPEASLILDLISSTGETKQVPRVLPDSLTIFGESVKIDRKDYATLQQYAGVRTMGGLEELTKDPNFNELTDEQKVKVITSALSDVSSGIKALVSAKQLIDLKNAGDDAKIKEIESTIKDAEMRTIQSAIEYLQKNPDFFKAKMNPLPKEDKTQSKNTLENGGMVLAGLGMIAATKGKEGRTLVKEGAENLLKKEANLLAVHSTTAKALQNIVKEGKIWGPSIGIFNKEAEKLPTSAFGDFHIVFNKNAVDPGRKDVIMYTDDVFSPRLITNEESLAKLKTDLAAGKEFVGGEIPDKPGSGEVPIHTTLAERVLSLEDLKKKASKLGSRSAARDSYLNIMAQTYNSFTKLVPDEIAKEIGDDTLSMNADGFLRTLAKEKNLNNTNAVKELFLDDYGFEINSKQAQEYLDEINNVVNNIKVEYFEAKALTGVELQKKNIDTVIMPLDSNIDLVKSLKDKGLDVSFYDRYDKSSISEALKDASKYAFGIGIIPATVTGLKSKNEELKTLKAKRDSLKEENTQLKEKVSAFKKEPAATKATITVYNPDPKQTDSSPHTGGFMTKMEFGDVAVGNRDEYTKAKNSFTKEGKDTFIIIPELKNVKTPYGNGKFRVRDTMNQRYDGEGRLDIFIPKGKEEIDRIVRRVPTGKYYYSL